MKTLSRQDFIRISAMLVASAWGGQVTGYAKERSLKLSFSTIGCPDWDFDHIVNFAKTHGYQGIEIRGIQRELDITKTAPFATKAARLQTMKILADAGIVLVGLGASTALHIQEPAQRKKHLDEAKRFIELAEQVECPYVRVFPDKLPPEQDKEQTLAFIAEGLQHLADFTTGSSVRVLMETHGDVVYANDILTVMKHVKHEKVGLIWDVYNMWKVTKEDPEGVYEMLRPYVHLVHLKDGPDKDGKIPYTALGKGLAPIKKAIQVLKSNNYAGFYSFEWEKLWHPALDEPEIALADFPRYMRSHF